MCGRFSLATTVSTINDQFGVHINIDLKPRYDHEDCLAK